VPFQIPEYERAFQAFVARSIDVFVDADPMLSRVHRVKVAESLAVQGPDGEVHDPQLIPVENQAAWQEVLDSDPESLQGTISAAADEYIRQVKAAMYEAMAAVPGGVINTGGQPLSWDLILDHSEQWQWSVDDDGAVRAPDVVMHPDARSRLGEMPAAQRERWREMQVRKQAEADVGRRSRRLP
jgi:hypothetical protein